MIGVGSWRNGGELGTESVHAAEDQRRREHLIHGGRDEGLRTRAPSDVTGR